MTTRYLLPALVLQCEEETLSKFDRELNDRIVTHKEDIFRLLKKLEVKNNIGR